MDSHITSGSPEETIQLGRKIGAQLKGGEIIALSGPLGSGKTYLIKGIAAGAGAENMQQVNSPTFVIVNQYSGRFEIYHVDAFRLKSQEEFEMVGFDELCGPGSVVLIEWADKVASALAKVDCIGIRILHSGATGRKIIISNTPTHIKL